MGFQLHKMSLIGNFVFTLITITDQAEASVFEQSDEQRVATACQGIPGRDGRDGRDGIQGPYGPPGNNALSAEFERKVEEILKSFSDRLNDAVEIGLASSTENQIGHKTESLETTGSTTQKSNGASEQSSIGGATYVRWGRNVCPPETLKLYSGFVAASHYSHQGSGANHMCLPMNPQWNRTVAGGHQSQSYLYGTEFEISVGNAGFHLDNAGGKSQHDHEALCAVCQTPGRLTHLMIPASLECPAGWNLEYLGFLMSGHHKHNKSEYVCVDQDPDVHPATSASMDGNLFYTVEVVCGALPCPPYVDGYEVTCVVCTQ